MSAETKRNWKETIRLPKTAFSMRADLAKREGAAIDAWEQDGIYQQMLEHRKGAPEFRLHDGPPYANGDIHHGHALNKILKDVVVKYRTLAGYRAPIIPGWDCHGLPIEQKVDAKLGKKKREMSVNEFRQACREYAAEQVDLQKAGFRRLMAFADWEAPYRTMNNNYEASTLRALGGLMDKGFLYKGLKPVHWSWSAVTALAEAEVEYAAYTAPSVYVRFPLPEPEAWLNGQLGGRSLDVVIWTTTPWTLPSNVAIALHPDLDYVALALNETEAILVAAGRMDVTLSECGIEEELEVLARFTGAELVGRGADDAKRPLARHPFIDRDSVLVAADYVTLEQGTGAVHTAPGHGQDDFMTGKKYGLDVLAPVNKYGKYTDAVPDYAGMHVFKANPLIAQRLEESGRLLNKAGDTYFIERYPHCWRTKKPLIFRATEQWFLSVDHDGLRGACLDAIGETEWVPHWGENRIRGMLEVRPDWCVSRQRTWGVPITCFHCESCDEHIVDGSVARHVAELSESLSSDVWFDREPAALVPEGYTCPHCGAGPEKFDKVEDILDVWFDSGVSWLAVLNDREGYEAQADLYLEGSDQHRGWFHTSLIVGAALKGRAPYKSVLTHGFVVDKDGRKYSKSSPNFEPLSKMLDQYGAEIMRLWVSMVDYRRDMMLAPELLKQTSGAYRKIRNTMRFLMGNLAGFNPTTELDLAAMSDVDRWALHKTAEFIERIRTGYESYEFHTVFDTLFEFCNETLSSIYLDVLKDQLYCDSASNASRAQAQAVLFEALKALVIAASPILSFTAEEAWSTMKQEGLLPDSTASVFLQDFPVAGEGWRSEVHAERMAELLDLRSTVNLVIESLRPSRKGEKVEGQIGSSQEAVVTLRVPAAKLEHYAGLSDALCKIAVVASVNVVGEERTDIAADIVPASGARCPRCWNYRESVGSNPAHPELCGRCADVVVSDSL